MCYHATLALLIVGLTLLISGASVTPGCVMERRIATMELMKPCAVRFMTPYMSQPLN